MDRRAFIGTLAGGLLAAPLAGEAQQAGKVYRIGFLRAGQPLALCVLGFVFPQSSGASLVGIGK